MSAARRQARIYVPKKGQDRTIRVSHPGQLQPDEIKRIDDVLIKKVIFELTGCSCLSGTHDVLWENDFDQVLDVPFGG